MWTRSIPRSRPNPELVRLWPSPHSRRLRLANLSVEFMLRYNLRIGPTTRTRSMRALRGGSAGKQLGVPGASSARRFGAPRQPSSAFFRVLGRHFPSLSGGVGCPSCFLLLGGFGTPYPSNAFCVLLPPNGPSSARRFGAPCQPRFPFFLRLGCNLRTLSGDIGCQSDLPLFVSLGIPSPSNVFCVLFPPNGRCSSCNVHA